MHNTSKQQTKILDNYPTEDQIVSSFKNSEINNQHIFESNLKRSENHQLLKKSKHVSSQHSRADSIPNQNTQHAQKISLLEELDNVNKMIRDIDQKIERTNNIAIRRKKD